jgi:hypothetical protein
MLKNQARGEVTQESDALEDVPGVCVGLTFDPLLPTTSACAFPIFMTALW